MKKKKERGRREREREEEKGIWLGLCMIVTKLCKIIVGQLFPLLKALAFSLSLPLNHFTETVVIVMREKG